jgi:large subunit ribosomal protein L11
MTILYSLIKGGEVTAAPPLGPLLGPLGLPVREVLKQRNEITKEYKGFKVKIKIIVDDKTKKFQILLEKVPVAVKISKFLGFAPKTHEKGLLTCTKEKFDQLVRSGLFTQTKGELEGTLKSMKIKIINK